MKFKPKEYPVDVRVILGIYSIGFLIGTCTHVLGILHNGFLAVAKSAPLSLNIYWDSLALLDPLAALLIWIKPRLGLGLAILIMFTDVIINACTYSVGYFGKPVAGMIPGFLFMQSLFATFIFATATVVLEKLQKAKVESLSDRRPQ